MRTFVVVMIVLLALPLPVAPAASDPLLPALAGANGPAFDTAYMKSVIPIFEEAVEVAMAATLYADHPDLLRWNQRLVQRKNDQVRSMLLWLRDAGTAPGQRNVGVQTAAVRKVRSLRGAALERYYLSLMAAHLERSAALSQLAARKATRLDLRQLGRATAKIEAQEATMLRGWLKKWYPEARG